jgi:hypothetical protein
VILQDVSFVEGQLVEVTYDYFAQADDGGVYYLGEDVTNYENGWIADHAGTWLVGRRRG